MATKREIEEIQELLAAWEDWLTAAREYGDAKTENIYNRVIREVRRVFRYDLKD